MSFLFPTVFPTYEAYYRVIYGKSRDVRWRVVPVFIGVTVVAGKMKEV